MKNRKDIERKIDEYFENISPEELEKKLVEHGFEFIIQPQDLRVGNKLLVNDLVATVVEIKVYTANIQYGEKYSIVEYEKLKPIEITEERLIELGFVKYRNYYHMYTRDNVLICYYGKGDLRYGGTYLERKINYIHELQNALYILSTPN